MKTNELLTPLKRFFNLLKVDRQEIISIYIYALFNGIVTLSIPIGIQAIISFITAGEVSSSWIVLVVFVIIGVGLAGAMQIMQLTITENLQQKLFARSAFEFAYRIPRMKMESINKFYMPEMVNRFFDTLTVQKGLPKILMDFSSASLQIIFGLILLSLYHPFFIMFSMVLILIVYLIFKFTTPRGLQTSLKESTYKYEVAHWLEELARANSTFKLAGKTPLPLDRTDKKVSDYLTYRKAHFKTLLLQYINLVGFKMIIAAGLLLIGGLLVINQQMNIGQFVAAEIVIILVLASVEKLILSMETIYDVLTAIEKVGSITDIPLEEDKGTPFNIKEDEGISIQAKNLSFQFVDSKQKIIDNVDFTVNSGEHLCVSGNGGSGKSFLLQMIAGIFDANQGSVSFNDMPISSFCREDLRSYIGDNLSREDIFKGTIIENITLGKPNISMDQIKEVVAVLGLSDFVSSTEYGYATTLLPEGKDLPKNIRLKIMLARSIVGTPKLVLLDDNFNFLVRNDREKFIDFLLDSKHNWTVIAISNEEEVAKRFEKVLVLDNGQIIAYDNLKGLKNEAWFNQIFQNK
jgi:ABC-type bacteriocin/lantibiotic exporter with double-glycine peptidase domain